MRTFDALAADEVGAWAGFWGSLLFLCAYSVTVLVYWILGHQSVAQGWLTVSPDRWHLVLPFVWIFSLSTICLLRVHGTHPAVFFR